MVKLAARLKARGASYLTTVMVKAAVAVLPAASFVVHVTFVAPTGKVVPDAGAQVTGRGPSTKSSADTVYFTAAPSAAVAATVMLAGMAMPGARVSGAFFDSLTSKQPTSPSPT